MAGCLRRCVAAVTCQLLVDVVSSLVMTHGADSDGSAGSLPGPHCLFLRPRILSVPSRLKATSARHGNERCVVTNTSRSLKCNLDMMQVFAIAAPSTRL